MLLLLQFSHPDLSLEEEPLMGKGGLIKEAIVKDKRMKENNYADDNSTQFISIKSLLSVHSCANPK